MTRRISIWGLRSKKTGLENSEALAEYRAAEKLGSHRAQTTQQHRPSCSMTPAHSDEAIAEFQEALRMYT